MMTQWMNAQKRRELFERLWRVNDELQAIAHLWWELDPEIQEHNESGTALHSEDCCPSDEGSSPPAP